MDTLIKSEITSYHAKYFAHELTKKLPSNSPGKFTAALQDAQVDLNPHQVEAALFAFKSPLSKGAILADEVGLGKTIEAGIILSQKWAEQKTKLLIIAPSNLRKQWSQELSDKFYLPSVILEGKPFNLEIKSGVANPFIKNEIVICSYQFARAQSRYISQIDWELVIIDEAHRLRNVYKPQNKIANAIKNALAHTQKVLLTATPLQNSLLELFGLVSIIDEYTFGDIKSFKSKFSKLATTADFIELKTRLTPVCKRTLRRQVLEYINYTNRIAIVEEFYPYKEEVELYDLVTEYLRSPVLYALPSSQRNLMTLILRKLLASSTFAIQGTLKGLAQKLDAVLEKQEELSSKHVFEGYENYDETEEEFNEGEEDSDEVSKPEKILTQEEIESIKREKESLNRFADLANLIIKNSKGDKLITALNKGFEKLQELGAPQKALIFTESTRTQEYLQKILESQGFEGKLVLFNGSNDDPKSKEIYTKWLNVHKGTDIISGSKSADMRQAIVDYFKESATIMIATEAAAEGINLQFCSLVVNYDLPWNPQRIEQRIGRCHRYGQKFDVVVINFLNKANEADLHVYKLLDEKFRLFSGVFGSSDEVLGSIESGIDFEKRIAKIYQECRRSEEITMAFDKLQQDLEPQIESNIETTRKKLLENFDEDVAKKLKVNLEQGREYLNQYEQWLWAVTRYYLHNFAEFDHADNSFNLLKSPFWDEIINFGLYQLLRASQTKKKSEVKIADKTNIYRVGHPLAKRIIRSCKDAVLETREITFHYSNNSKIISPIEKLVGKTGWLSANLITIKSVETEETILFSCFTSDGEMLDSDICRKFFSLDATEGETMYPPSEITLQFERLIAEQKITLLNENMARNVKFFDEEYEKLDKWAEDMKLSLEKEIKDLDAEIKLRKAEVRKLTDLSSKIAEQRIIKDLDKKRNEKRRSLFESQDMVDEKKENLITDIEGRLKQTTLFKKLFLIKWQVI